MTVHPHAVATEFENEPAPISRCVRPLRWVGLLGQVGPPMLAKDAFFVSSARKDQKSVRRIVNEGRAAGHQFWIDRTNITPGRTWAGAIVAAIRASRGLVVFCSPAAYASDQVLREVALAARYKKAMLPLILEGGRGPDAFLYYLGIHQSIDVGADPEWRVRFLDALESLEQGRSRLS